MKAIELYKKTIRIQATDPKVSERNAYIEELDTKGGSTKKTFSKNLFHSLLALGTTKTYIELEEDPLEEIIYRASRSIDLSAHYSDYSTKMGRNYSLLSSSKKLKQVDINGIMNLEELEIGSPSLIFLLYFMTSLSNLNNLTEDFQKIYLKPSAEIWEKTGYIHQPISEIYREELLFALLLEFLNIASFGWNVCTVSNVDPNEPDAKKFQKIYNSYLDYYSNRFHKYYEYKAGDDDVEEPSYIPEYRIDQKVVKPSVFSKTVRGTLYYPNYHEKNYTDFRLPNEIMNLTKKDSKQVFSFLAELFILSVNPDLIKEVTTNRSFYGSPESVRKYNRYSLDIIIASNNENIEEDYIPEEEIDVYLGQQRRTLRNKSSGTDTHSELIHYYINPKIKDLVDIFTNKHNLELDPQYHFIQFNL